MKTETFTGTLAEVQSKAADWKTAHPSIRLIQEYAPFAVGERTELIDKPIWTLTIRSKTPNQIRTLPISTKGVIATSMAIGTFHISKTKDKSKVIKTAKQPVWVLSVAR